MSDAFAHHVWATLRLLDTCLQLTPEQLQTNVPGTYGTILDTQRHLVGADASYLSVLSGGKVDMIEEDQMDLSGLRAVMVSHGPVWAEVLAAEPDPEAMVTRHREDGSQSHAPAGIRLAQVVHHGTDHRSQICTALTTLGITPPEIDVWDFGWESGTVTETPAAS
jgi:uncharacterized damage-inducible protein DinB